MLKTKVYIAFRAITYLNQQFYMPYLPQLSETLASKLSTASLQRFLATEGIILEAYSKDFLLAINQEEWHLSLLGNDTAQNHVVDVHDYFDKAFQILIENPHEYYIYGRNGRIHELCQNSALVLLTQCREEYLSML